MDGGAHRLATPYKDVSVSGAVYSYGFKILYVKQMLIHLSGISGSFRAYNL